MLVSVLQDLCPRCGEEWFDDTRACPACGFDRIGSRTPAGGAIGRGIQLRPMDIAALVLAMLGVVVVALGAGLSLRAPLAGDDATEAPTGAVADARDFVAPLGRVRFAERLGESLDLESYRTQFTAEDTIAWRAEFQQEPPTSEVTVVIAWQSIRERMQLSSTTVTLRDAELTMIASDEVPLSDLVPTAGVYSVSYYAGDVKLAEGVFELLPPGR